MPFLLRNLTLNLDESEELLPAKVAARLAIPPEAILTFAINRKAVDARHKGRIKFVYTVEFRLAGEELVRMRTAVDPDLQYLAEPVELRLPQLVSQRKICVAGMGPAGLFAALRLAAYGLAPILIERGKPIHERLQDVQAFWGKGLLDPESNVQFGEGGAGTFSDGKLTTRVKDPNIDYILRELVRFGAPPEIAWLAKPHIGTDRLREVVSNLRRHLTAQGVDIRFQTRLSDIVSSGQQLGSIILNGHEEQPCDILVLAPGHSARDTYEMLARQAVMLEAKPFAIGLRVEHPQELINRIQYGLPCHPRLPPADYALAFNDRSTGRSAYSFCMCPGGVVVAGSTEEGGVVTNGMSLHRRNSPYANSALVVTVGRNDFAGDSVLAGMEFQRTLERNAFVAGGGRYAAPAQNLLAFLGDRKPGPTVSSYRPGVREADLARLLPEYVTRTLREGIRQFERKMRGFITGEACLTGVETRTSAPVRIVRGDNLQSVSIRGLYPAGEGAGYAGGIMSAALDGVRIADRIATELMTCR